MTALKRIILHWTAGGAAASALDLEHYHFVVNQDGLVRTGKLPPEANAVIKAGQSYAAHTRSCNTGSIGVAVAGMSLAIHSPFHPGTNPLQPGQMRALYGFVQQLAKTYAIPITRQTVLTHAEVQPTLGIKQSGKWDIAWLPGMAKPGDPVAVGDIIRAAIINHRED
jgi:N-acetyl-anhydromuramyl-L-alanine amidase AmpD